jgi:hypothetical protein
MIDKVGRNDPCPCGSGNKYKKCCFGKQNVENFENKDVSDLKCFEADPDPIQHVEGYDAQKWEAISERIFGDKESFANLMYNWAGIANSLCKSDEPLDFAFAQTGPFKIFLLRDDSGIIDEHQVGAAITHDIDRQLNKKLSKRR